MNRAALFWYALSLTLISSLGAASCADEVSKSALENAADVESRDLGGPPGDAYFFRGFIGDRPVFVGELRNYVPGWHMPGHQYSPSEGWSSAAFPQTAWSIYSTSERIVEAGGDHFFVEDITDTQTSTLYRSTDDGQSWEALELDAEHGQQLQSDGEALYLYEETGTTSERVRKLWQSTDGGQSWSVLRDDLADRWYIAVAGRLLVPVGDRQNMTIELSLDRGETWEALPADTPLGGLDRRVDFHVAGDIALKGNGTSIAVWEEPDQIIYHEIPGLPGGITELALTDDGAYATTVGDTLGKLEGDPSEWATQSPTWREIPLPEDAALRTDFGNDEELRTLFAFDDGSVAVLGEAGLWRSPDDGQSWELVGHPYSSPDYLLDDGDTLVTGRAGEFYRKASGESDWTAMEISSELRSNLFNAIPTHVDGQLYAVSSGRQAPTVFELDLEQQSIEKVWEDANVVESYDGLGNQPAAHLLSVDGELIIGSAGSFREVITANGNTILDYSGGGVYAVDPATGETRVLADDSGTDPLLMVQDMVMHDGELWALTATRGVWRIALDGSGPARAHEGLPDEDVTHVMDLVTGLFSTGEALYAWSTNKLFMLEGDTWTELPVDAFYETAEITGLDPLGIEPNTNAIRAVDSLGDFLLVATLNRLYVLDPTSYEFMATSAEFDRPIYRLLWADSELYVSLWQGGLHRIELND